MKQVRTPWQRVLVALAVSGSGLGASVVHAQDPELDFCAFFTRYGIVPPGGCCDNDPNTSCFVDGSEQPIPDLEITDGASNSGPEECGNSNFDNIKSGAATPSSPFFTNQPVDLRTGDKISSETDIVVPLPGDDFTITRRYSSNPIYSRGNYIGYNSRLDQMAYIYVRQDVGSVGGIPSGFDLAWWRHSGNSSIRFEKNGAASWQSPPGVDYSIHVNDGEFGEPNGTLTLTKPGAWTKTYKNLSSQQYEGSYFLESVRDVTGKMYVYHWGTFASSSWPRLESIAIYTGYFQPISSTEHNNLLAFINVIWGTYDVQFGEFSPFTSSIPERIIGIEVMRPLDLSNATAPSSNWITTQAVYYSYRDNIMGGPLPDFGDEPGALIWKEQYEITSEGLANSAVPTLTFSEITTELSDGLPNSPDGTLINLSPQSTPQEPFYASIGDNYRRRITLYKYYPDNDPDGSMGQLRAVYEPEQVEFWEQNTHLVKDQFSRFLAEELLWKHSDAAIAIQGASTPTGDLTVKDLAAKIIKYNISGPYSGMVREQIVQTNCGCGGASGLGKRLTYDYKDPVLDTNLTNWDDGPDNDIQRIVRVYEEQADGSNVWKPFRQDRYDMVDLSGAINFDTKASEVKQWNTKYHMLIEMEEPTTTQEPFGKERRSWITKYEYYDQRVTGAGDASQIARVLTPSSFARRWDDPSTSIPELVNTGGLVYHYRYFTPDESATKAPMSKYVALSSAQSTGSPADWDQWINFALIRGYDWYNLSGSLRHDLPVAINNYRNGSWPSGSPAATANEIESTTFTYSVTTSAVVFDRTVKVEIERNSENGDESGGTTFDTFGTRDFFGDLIEAIEPDGAKHAYDRNPYLGTVTKHTWSDGATTNPIQLVTEYTYDSRGRVIVERAPSGATTNYEYDMFVLPDAAAVSVAEAAGTGTPNWSGFVPVYGMREYTPEAESGIIPSGPVITTYYNAANKYLGRQVHSVFSLSRNPDGTINQNTSAQYPVEDLDKELERELALRGLDGLVRTHESYHDLASPGGKKYTTTYAYDTLGRLRDLTNPLGTVTTYDYDVLYRVIAEYTRTSTGTLSPLTETTRQYEYDWFDGQSTPQTSSFDNEQGVGNGNLRTIHEITYTGNRITEFEYDFRDRRIATSAGFDARGAQSKPSNPEIRERLEYDNLDRVTAREMYSGGNAPNFNAANRGWREEYFYNQRGLSYQRKAFTDPATTSASAVVWNTWFDEVGRPIAQEQPNGPAVKRLYDGLGRLSKMYITDRGGDADAGAAGNFASALDVTGDIVLEQYNLRYAVNGVDGAGQVEFVESFRRAHNATLTGALDIHDANAAISTDEAQVIATYSATYFDAADRPEFTVEFGVGDDLTDTFAARGTAFTRPPRTTNPSFPKVDAAVADKLVTRLFYNSRSLIDRVREPDDQFTKYYYDDMNRQVGVYENADLSFGVAQVNRGLQRSSSVPWGFEPINTTSWDVDKDRLTVFAYDGSSNITHRVAYNQTPSGLETQVTQYEYGVSRATSGNLIDSNDLLAAVTYPDEFGVGAPKKVTYQYNGLGEVTAMTDQNGTSHAYTRDLLGRVRFDVASFAAGTSIDQTLKTIAMEYDKLGRLTKVGSYQSADTQSLGSPDNEMAYAYNGLWQLTALTQNPTGATGSGDSAVVDYSYTANATGTSGTYQRLTNMLYPSNPAGGTRTDLTIGYDIEAVDSAISRASRLSLPDQNNPTTRNIDYRFVGMGMPVVKRYDENSIQLDRWADPSASGALAAHVTGTYAGLDRYGRIKHQLWVNEANATTMKSWTGAGTGATAARFDMVYTYDNASDILTRTDARPGATGTTRDERYTYDGLNRLIKAEHGVSSGGGTTFTPGNSTFSQQWDYDHLGNQLSVISDTNAGATQFDPGVDLTLARLFNAVNEVDTQNLSAEGQTPIAQTVSYDDAGNQTTDDTRAYTYDAWNRLVGVDASALPRTRTTYYGLHQRATRSADTDPASSGGIKEHNLYYYDAAWRLIEERVYDDVGNDDVLNGTSGPDTLQRITQRVWGLTYIDELCVQLDDLHDGTNEPDGDMTAGFGTGTEKLYYALCDRRYDVVELADNTGAVQERVRYSAYGKAWVTRDGDANRSGAIDGADLGLLMGAWGSSYGDANFNPDVDLNNDGTVDGADMGILLGAWGSYDTSVSGVGNTVMYAGYLYDAAVGLHLARFRWYDADRGRWVTRDPINYAGWSSSLYQYVSSRAMSYSDPLGLMELTPNDLEHLQDLLDQRRRNKWRDWCNSLTNKINNVDKQIKKRENDIERNNHPEKQFCSKPMTTPNDVLKPSESVRGHRRLLHWLRKYRRYLSNEWVKKCGGNGPPEDWKQNSPVPSWQQPKRLPLMPNSHGPWPEKYSWWYRFGWTLWYGTPTPPGGLQPIEITFPSWLFIPGGGGTVPAIAPKFIPKLLPAAA